MFDLSLVFYTLSSLLEGVHVVIGVVVLALTAKVATDRKGLVAAGGIVFGIGALGDVVTRAWVFYVLYLGPLTDPLSGLPFVLRSDGGGSGGGDGGGGS
ncbi:hypothetical protein A6A08_14785 [Nocardiopsis sp. TSRI0078]|uniref:hypothetical protein n=1 Tax=unclassified Nocardiopsis TaxID=2649073 RepID=UPI00093C25C2|nr:hypothetical protein [Nocardiopsis sp. TSRI0078]OKI13551.1 hypothetical protein A6A08_14785 [Nocardiopsis sp. TSRI0078]